MSDTLTQIELPCSKWSGLMSHGVKSAKEMIQEARDHVKYVKERADKEYDLVMNAPDEEFQIDVVRGVHVQHHVRTVQKSKLKIENI